MRKIRSFYKHKKKNDVLTLGPFNADFVGLGSFEGMKLYRKRPVVVRAIQLNYPKGFKITTNKGIVYGEAGDYLIIDAYGEKYHCAKEVFEKTYQLVDIRGGDKR